MNEQELQKIAETWITLYYLPEDSDERKGNFWAYNKLCDLEYNEPETCWKIIQLICRLDGSDVVLANLAAGPLESLLANHGNGFIDRIESLAQTDQQFRKLLGAVWQNNITDATWARIKAVAAQSW